MEAERCTVRVPVLPDGHAGDRAPPGLRPRRPAAAPRRARHARRPTRSSRSDGNGRGPRSARRTGSRRAAGSSRSPTSTTRPSRASGGGRPFRGMEVRIADPETDEELAPGEVGQILVRGAGLFDGYHDDPRRRRRRCAAAGSTRATSASSTPTGASPTAGAPRTCSRSAARTSRRWRSRRSCSAIRRSRSSRSSASPTPGTSRCRPRSWSSRPDATATEEELIAFCRGRIASFKVPRLRPLRRRVADVRDEDPEAPAARGAARRARGRVMQHRIILVDTRPASPSPRRTGTGTSGTRTSTSPTPLLAGYVQNRPLEEEWERLGSRSICSETWFADHDAEKASFASDYYRDDRHARRAALPRPRERVDGPLPRRAAVARPARRATACSRSGQSSAGASDATVDRPPVTVASVWLDDRDEALALARAVDGHAFAAEPAVLRLPSGRVAWASSSSSRRRSPSGPSTSGSSGASR